MDITPAEYLEKFICPICKDVITRSEYLAGVFSDEPKLEYIANLVTHYRHAHISSWNRMWGHYGRSYRSAAKFGDYEAEKKKVNERAKRQLIRSCYPIFVLLDITAEMFTRLENTDRYTLQIANEFLNGKVDLPELPKEQIMTEDLKDTDKIDFGIHQGKALANVPDDYLLWCYHEKKLDKRPRLKKYVEDNLNIKK